MEYQKTLEKLGLNKNTANILKDWAHLKAYYMNDLDTAIVMLKSAMGTPGLYNKVAAGIKLELADIYMIINDVWDASLLYLQVDKDFKNDVLGHEAKFRNARLYYYTGNFGWAKAQLDVLKASTSKLIANDAMELSLLISDNLALDTIEIPLQMFARADLLYLQHKDSATIQILDSITEQYPGHSLQDEIYFKKYEIAYRNKNYEEARDYLEKIIEVFPFDILADKAIFNLAVLYEYQYDNTVKASELYELILMNYPNSLYVDDARKKFREIRGDLTE
jgi:tetratricopeptide (TPR) repeat protein